MGSEITSGIKERCEMVQPKEDGRKLLM